jgi:hypothetical protein
VTGPIRVDVQELHQPVWLGIVEGLEQDCVDDGKDRSISSDTQRQGRNGGYGERGVGDQHAKGIFEVAVKITHIFAILQRGSRDRGVRAIRFELADQAGDKHSRALVEPLRLKSLIFGKFPCGKSEQAPYRKPPSQLIVVGRDKRSEENGHPVHLCPGP